MMLTKIKVLVFVVVLITIFVAIFLIVKSERDRYYDFCVFKDVCYVNPKTWFSLSKITEDFGQGCCFNSRKNLQRVQNGLGIFYRQEFLFNPKDLVTIGKGHLIAIKTNQLKDFYEILTKNILKTFPFVLIATDCDDSASSFSEEIRQILKHHRLVKFYCQNLDVPFYNHPKLEPLPIGINYHDEFFKQNKTFESFIFGPFKNEFKNSPAGQEEELFKVLNELPPPSERPPLAYTSATLNTTDSMEITKHPYKGLRKELKDRKDEFKGIITYQEEWISRSETWKRHGDFLFIVSPPGAGLDCFRTWEALILGNIPILVKTPPFTETSLFDDLPVIFVENYSEITLENMKAWKDAFVENFETYNFEKLKMKYWEDKFVEDLGGLLTTPI